MFVKGVNRSDKPRELSPAVPPYSSGFTGSLSCSYYSGYNFITEDVFIFEFSNFSLDCCCVVAKKNLFLKVSRNFWEEPLLAFFPKSWK